jgi:hypothetical protein
MLRNPEKLTMSDLWDRVTKYLTSHFLIGHPFYAFRNYRDRAFGFELVTQNQFLGFETAA